MFKFLHAADLHLDSPLVGLERYDGAPVEKIRLATRRALENLVQLAIDEQVAFVLLAGDLYDGDWKDYNTGLYFAAQMARLREAAIPVFAIAGNHDAANKMTRLLRLPDNVRILSADKPETKVLEEVGVAIHGQGFPTAAVWDNLAQRYPPPQRGFFNIGLLHTCATCQEGHERYAPCQLDDLRAKQYDYWALGHVHQRQVLHDDPHIVFPGNLQGRHIREAGVKGCYLATVEHGRRVELTFRPLDVLRWQRCQVDATDLPDPDAVLEQVGYQLTNLRHQGDGLPLAVRVEIIGPCAAHDYLLADPQRWSNEVRGRALEVGGEQIWIEKVRFDTSSPRVVANTALDGPLEELAVILAELRQDDKQLLEVGSQLTDLKRKLPPELKEGPDALDVGDPACLRRLLDQVQPLLLGRLLFEDHAS